MKLLLISVSSDKAKGGIAVWTRSYLLACEENGIFCDLVNTEAVGNRRENGSASRNFSDEFYRTRRIFKDLKTALKRHGKEYDAVHLNTSCGTFGLFRDYMIAKRVKRRGLRLITHYHCDIPHWIHRSISKRCLERLASLSDENLVLCGTSRSYLERKFGIKSTLMPNFVDEATLLSEKKKISETVKRVAFVGGITREKGAEELYEISRCFPRITFELIGNVSEEVAAWELPENVILAGGMSHDEVISRLDASDVFLFPSHTEGFSLALTEAMARGLPCIATDVGANADMLSAGRGIVVDVGDVDGMRVALETLGDAALREQISENARCHVRNEYTPNAILSRLHSVYSE